LENLHIETPKISIPNLKPFVHLSRAFGYRELGMYDQSFLELEEIMGD